MSARGRTLSAAMALNAGAAGAAATVLALRPGLIPAVVGLALSSGDLLVARLLAAAELAMAVLAAAALLSRSVAARRQAAIVLVIFHGASGVAGLAAVSSGAVLVLGNVVARITIIALLLWSAAPLLGRRGRLSLRSRDRLESS